MQCLYKGALVALFLLLPVASAAAPIHYVFDSILVLDPGGAAAGSTTADVILTIDSLAPDQDASASLGVYAVDAARIEFSNGYVSTLSTTGLLEIRPSGSSHSGSFRWTAPSPALIDFGGWLTPAPTTDALLTSGTFAVVSNAVTYVQTDDVGLIVPMATSLTITPEPGAGLLLAAGLAGLAGRSRRRS